MSKQNKTRQTTRGRGSHSIRLELIRPHAREVSVAGSFNLWQPTATPLTLSGEGKWVVELSLPPGRYEYRFIVDGEWVDDPAATEVVPNPHGGANALLVVPPA